MPALDATAFAVPLRTRFRRLDRREGMLLRGPAGYGEFSPFAEYPPHVCARWLRAAVEAAHGDWPAPVRDRVPVNVTIPAVPPDAVAALVSGSGGCRTAKVKVAEPGESLADDVARVRAVRAALGTAGRIRIDANGAWDAVTAVRAIKRLSEFDLEYVEQPCRGLDDMAVVRRSVEVPLAADESVRLAEDPPVRALREAADLIVLKVQPLGGVRAALRVAERVGLPAVVSSAVETSVGLAAGVALGAALPELRYACGLGTGLLLADDLVADRLLPVDGAVPAGPVTVDPAALRRCAAAPQSARWWSHRLGAARRAGDAAREAA